MIVGLVGHAGSGKDTVADMLGWKRMSFAEPMKRFCMEVFDWSEEQVFGPSARRAEPDARYVREDGEWLTPRFALQTLGTEWGRRCCPGIWVKYCIRKALAAGEDVVIADCRFINEAQAIRAVGGEVWRIVRPGALLDGAAGQHVSEQEQDSPEMETLIARTISNTGTLEDLRLRVAEARIPRGTCVSCDSGERPVNKSGWCWSCFMDAKLAGRM